MPIESLEEFRAAVSKLDDADDLISFHTQAVESEKSRGVTAKHKVNKEAEGLRVYKAAVEALGYDGESELEDFLETLKTPAAPPTKDGPSPELIKLRKDFEKSQKDGIAATERATAIEAKAGRKTIRAKLLTSDFGKKVLSAEYVAESLINNGLVALEDDDVVVFKDGDNIIDFETGCKKFYEAHPETIKNTQAPGGRSTSQNTTATGESYTPEKVKRMSQEDIAANLPAIRADLKAQGTT